MNSKQHKAWRKCRIAQELHKRGHIENVRAMLMTSIYPKVYKRGKATTGTLLGRYKGKMANKVKPAELHRVKNLWRKRLERIHEHIQLEMLELIP